MTRREKLDEIFKDVETNKKELIKNGRAKENAIY